MKVRDHGCRIFKILTSTDEIIEFTQVL
jgi:hypothetical protein